MKKKTFKVTEEQEFQLKKLGDFFNTKTDQKTLNRILDFATKKLTE